MSMVSVRPSTIDGIKRLASQLKKSEGLPHAQALDHASRAADFQNYAHARRALGRLGAPTVPHHDLYITAHWRDRDAGTEGTEFLRIALPRPLDEMIKPQAYRWTRELSPMRRLAPDHIERSSLLDSRDRARHDICAAARLFQFMAATGLQPSSAHARTLPRGNHSNRLPGADHDSEWFDPVARQYIAATEPYRAAARHHADDRLGWSRKHGWEVTTTKWPGMYNPDGGSELYLSTDASKGYSLAPIVARLDAAPPPIIEDEWVGETRPRIPIFISPGVAAIAAAKVSKPVTKRRPRAPNNTLPYHMVLGGPGRRPAKRMSVEAHSAVGRLLKSALIGTRQRAGVYKRVDSVRCELDDWVQCEYDRTELSDEVFFDLYYHELDTEARPADKNEQIANLESAKDLLAQHYPDCGPLRDLLKRLDQAIASLRSWQ